MGTCVSLIKINQAKKAALPLLNISLGKLREFHGSFKSVCDNFSIDLTEFEQIFGTNESNFVIFDTDRNGLIDALELFSGLVIFSDAKFEEKIRFLFDLFDFNELNSLSLIDLEFMINCCISATYKIFCIISDPEQEQILKFVSSNFTDDTRITISQLIKWCVKSAEIRDFFETLKQEMDVSSFLLETPGSKAFSLYTDINGSMKSYVRNLIQRPLSGPTGSKFKSAGKFLNSESYSEKLLWAQSLTQKIFHSPDTSYPIKNSKVELSWVYGHQTESNAQKMIFYESFSASGKFEEALIYYISKIVVIYQMKTHTQKHYLSHEKEVSCITGSKRGLCATGEQADLPSIHIWDIESQKTVSVLRGIHRGSIYLLSFICNDQYLVSTGERLSTPVIVYRLKDNSVVLTSYFTDPLLCLTKCQSLLGAVPMGNQSRVLGTKRLISSNIADYESVFVFSSAYQLYLYEINPIGALKFSIADLRQQKDIELSPITCLVAIWVNLQDPELHAYSKSGDRGIRILTGHLDGQVLVWIGVPSLSNFKKDRKGFANFKISFSHPLTKTPYKHPIIKLLHQEKSTIVVSDDGFLHYWDAALKENYKNVDLSSLPNREFRSLKLTDIIVAKSKLILTTIEGDVLEIAMEMKKEWSKNTFAYVIKEKKLRTFVRLGGKMNCMSLVEKENGSGFLYVAGENARVFGFSKETHEVIDSWSMEEPLTAMDTVSFPDGGIAFAFGTLKGRLQLRIDWEEIPRHYNINHRINDIKFTGDATYLAAAAENKFIYIFNYSSDSYFKNPCKRVEFEKEIPVTLNFLDDFRTLVAGTNLGSHFTLDVPDLKNMSQLVENDKLDVSMFHGRFPKDIKSKEKVFLPFVMGQQVKFIVGGDENGNLLFWKDKEELQNNSGSLLPGHNSPIVAVVVSKSQESFYTLGLEDNLLLEWKVNIEAVLSENVKLMLDPMEAEKVHDATTYDDVILRELNFSIISFDMKQKVSDSACVFRGTNSPVINTLIQGTYPELDENNFVQKRVPQVVVELEQVFGFHSFASRRTLAYVHYFLLYKNKQKGIKIMQSTSGTEGSKKVPAAMAASKAIQKMLSRSKLNQEDPDSLQPYLAKHNDCERSMVYFVSRIVIVYDPSQNRQRFYQSHQAKITCMAIHPSKSIVASTECSLSGPLIHIWSIYSLEALKILKASHSNGVLAMSFSKDGSYLVSIATDKVFSVEIWDWHNEISKCFRNTGVPPILDVQFNPHNPMQIATGGYNHVALWEIKGTSLLRDQIIYLNEEDKAYLPFVTALSFGSYLLGEKVVTDIILGTNYGDIGVVSAGSFCTVKKKAHSKMINTVQVVDLYKDKTLVVTAGEDEMIRLWSFNFSLLSEFSIRHCELFPPKISANLSAQSIDFFVCPSAKPIPWAGGDDRTTNPIMLVGTRNGDIFEVKYNRQITGSTKVRFVKKHTEEEPMSPVHISPNHLKENISAPHSSNLDMVVLRGAESMLHHPHHMESASASNTSSHVQSDSEAPPNTNSWGRHQNPSLVPSHTRIEDERSSPNLDIQGGGRIGYSRDYDESASPIGIEPNERAGFNFQDDEEEESEEEEEEDGDMGPFEGEKNERFSFAAQAVLRNHCIQHPTTSSNIYSFFSQKKVHVALHPKHNIAVTVGDQNAIVWNLDTHQDLTQKHLDGIATCAIFSPDGNILAIGFTSSTVTLYESKIDVSTFGKLPDRYKTSPFELKAILKCKDSKLFPVISMEFSPSGNMFAVSFDNNKAQVQEDEASFGRANSFVTVYMSTTSKKNYGKHHLTDSKQSYIKYTEIKCPSLYEAPRSKNQMGMAVHFMTFSMDEDYLMLYYQLVDSFQTRDNKNLSDCSYVIWDLHTDNQVNNLETLKSVSFKMNQFHFPNHINGEFNQLNLLGKDKKTQRSVQISSVETIHDLNTLILGNIYGDLHIVRSSFLTASQALTTDKLSLKNFVQSKSYSGHASFVSQILLSWKKDYLVTTGIYDEAFFKWRIKKEEKMWDIDHMLFATDAEDVFKETETHQQFMNLKDVLLPGRLRIIEYRKQLAQTSGQLMSTTPPRIYLNLEKILNRKAFSRRNNLFMSKDKRLVYSVGSQVVLLDPWSTLRLGSPIRQEFIAPESYLEASTFPEVSCLQMAPNEMHLAVGTTQLGAKIIIWELTSRTFLSETILSDCISVQAIAYACDSRHLVAIGLHRNYYQMVYYIDSAVYEVKTASSLTFSYPFKIKYVEFIPNSINSFVTCGIQHIAKWNFAGSYLSFESFPIENPKANSGEIDPEMESPNRRLLAKGGGSNFHNRGIELEEEMGEGESEEDEENLSSRMLKCSFLGIIFVMETMLTVGDDGMIYIWRDGKITKKQNAHSHSPIFALAKSKRHPLRFATGGMDGRVVIWDLKHSVTTDFFSLETVLVHALSPEAGKESICTKPEFHVQSLVYGVCEGEEEDTLYLGTKTGDIHVLQLMGLNSEQKVVSKAPEAQGTQLLFSEDTQVVKEAGFSVDNSRVYTITENGLFSIFDFASLRKIFSLDFNKTALNLVVCKHIPRVILVFETDVDVFSVDESEKEGIHQMVAFGLQTQTPISYMDVSSDEATMAIAMANNAELSARIDIYHINHELQQFKLLSTIPNISSSIEFIDFSSNSAYLLFRDSGGMLMYYDLANQNKTEVANLESNIEWVSEGLKVNGKTTVLEDLYKDANKVIKIKKLSSKDIVVTDDCGTLKLFGYPCETGASFYQIYSEHLNAITVCSVSPDRSFLLTSSSSDRAIFLWKIHKEFEDEIEVERDTSNLEEEEDEDRVALIT